MIKFENISVCVCTYKRPQLLNRLLEKLIVQKSGDFTFSVVVIDNDSEQSARVVAQRFNNKNKIPIYYHCESRKSISYARNCAIENASGKYLAFIDDDEYPDVNWLHELYSAKKDYGADCILGPVIPHFEVKPPRWLKEICERPSFESGTILTTKYTRTGNVLFDGEIFKDPSNRFDSSFGLTGGEDTDFFNRILKKGYSAVWCNEAVVFENVPPDRWSKEFYIKRAFLRGSVNDFYSRRLSFMKRSSILVRSAMLFFGYSFALPFIIWNDSICMKFYNRYFHHAGRLVTALGLTPVCKRK
jgi:succinoglycan biosynthesis protein ExoM